MHIQQKSDEQCTWRCDRSCVFLYVFFVGLCVCVCMSSRVCFCAVSLLYLLQFHLHLALHIIGSTEDVNEIVWYISIQQHHHHSITHNDSLGWLSLYLLHAFSNEEKFYSKSWFDNRLLIENCRTHNVCISYLSVTIRRFSSSSSFSFFSISTLHASGSCFIFCISLLSIRPHQYANRKKITLYWTLTCNNKPILFSLHSFSLCPRVHFCGHHRIYSSFKRKNDVQAINSLALYNTKNEFKWKIIIFLHAYTCLTNLPV